MSDTAAPRAESPLRSLTGVQIVGAGSFLPDKVVANEDLEALGCDADWIVKRTGIRERRHAPAGTATSDLAVRAAERCLASSGVERSDVDLLLLATCSPDRLMPATATTVQHRLGLNCGAMDLSAVCAGFTYALATGMQFVATGCSRRALVIGADVNSRILDPADKKTYPIFGDGAGAVLLAAGSPEQGALAYSLGSDGGGADLLCRPVGGTLQPFQAGNVDQGSWFMQMEGRAVFKWAVRLLEDNLQRVLDAAGLGVAQIDCWLLHQANVRILDAAAESLGIDRA
ncbi:MAG: beta-ketoacyl-ACP synthase 3, partial [Planctomycetota bacterium]